MENKEIRVSGEPQDDATAYAITKLAEIKKGLRETITAAYRLGFKDGLTTFAWWKDGVQQVGFCGTPLFEAIENVETLWNYNPPTKALEDK